MGDFLANLPAIHSMNPENEQHDPTWDLLKKARPVRVEPAFTQNVLREVRKLGAEAQERPGFGAWLAGIFTPPRLAWGFAAAATAAAAVFFAASQGGDDIVQPNIATDSGDKASESVERIQVVDFESEIESLVQYESLLAVKDASELEDDEVDMLLFSLN